MDKTPPRQPAARLARRAPGRPPDDADRRALALDAALDCYVRRGIAATTLRDIAAAAGVTPALLHYYFRDAAGLREAVIAGYRSERPLPDSELERLPLFMLARGLSYVGWVHTRPETETARDMTPQVIEWACTLAEQYLNA